jgi:hypothetical protein
MVVGVAPEANAGMRLSARYFDCGGTRSWPSVQPNLQLPVKKNKTIRLENVGRN